MGFVTRQLLEPLTTTLALRSGIDIRTDSLGDSFQQFDLALSQATIDVVTHPN